MSNTLKISILNAIWSVICITIMQSFPIIQEFWFTVTMIIIVGQSAIILLLGNKIGENQEETICRYSWHNNALLEGFQGNSFHFGDKVLTIGEKWICGYNSYRGGIEWDEVTIKSYTTIDMKVVSVTVNLGNGFVNIDSPDLFACKGGW